MVGTGEIEYPGWTKTSTTALWQRRTFKGLGKKPRQKISLIKGLDGIPITGIGCCRNRHTLNNIIKENGVKSKRPDTRGNPFGLK